MVRPHLNLHIAVAAIVVIAAAKRCYCLLDHLQSHGLLAGLSMSDSSEWSSDSSGFYEHYVQNWHGRGYWPWNYFGA